MTKLPQTATVEEEEPFHDSVSSLVPKNTHSPVIGKSSTITSNGSVLASSTGSRLPQLRKSVSPPAAVPVEQPISVSKVPPAPGNSEENLARWKRAQALKAANVKAKTTEMVDTNGNQARSGRAHV